MTTETAFSIINLPLYREQQFEAIAARIEREEGEEAAQKKAWVAKHNPKTSRPNPKTPRPRVVYSKRQITAKEYLMLHPDWTNQRIAEACGVTSQTIGRVRKRLIQSGKLSDCDRRTGVDGRIYSPAGRCVHL